MKKLITLIALATLSMTAVAKDYTIQEIEHLSEYTIQELELKVMNAQNASDTSAVKLLKNMIVEQKAYEQSLVASDSYSKIESFAFHCGMIEDVYISDAGIIQMGEFYSAGVDVDAFLNLERKFTQRLIDEDELGGVIACAKLKERLKRRGLFYGFFSSYL